MSTPPEEWASVDRWLATLQGHAQGAAADPQAAGLRDALQRWAADGDLAASSAADDERAAQALLARLRTEGLLHRPAANRPWRSALRATTAIAAAVVLGVVLTLVPLPREEAAPYPEPPTYRGGPNEVRQVVKSPRAAAESLVRDLAAMGLNPALYAQDGRYFVDLTVNVEEMDRLRTLAPLAGVTLVPGLLRVAFEPQP